MPDTKNKIKKENPMADYDPKDRDFQRTEDDLDNVSKSEKDALEKKRKETEKAANKDDVQQ